MEHLELNFAGRPGKAYKRHQAIAGVVASGNLEALLRHRELGGECRFAVDTAAEGFAATWKAVLGDFVERHQAGNLQVDINDNAASPAVVALRLDQALEALDK